MGATWSFSKTFTAGDVLTASELNTVQSDVTTNFTPAGMDDQSTNLAAMKVTADPYPAASESLATDLAGELQRLRFMIDQIVGEAQWYIDPDTDIVNLYANTPVSATNWPSFSVHKNTTSQTAITGIDKITWDGANALFDTNSDFDDANDRFTPTVAGKYILTSGLELVTISAGETIIIYIYKNGAALHVARTVVHGAAAGVYISAVVDANGSGDYFEIFATNGSHDLMSITGALISSWFTGCRIG